MNIANPDKILPAAESDVLLQSIISTSVLQEGWKKVVANDGCAGTDNITIHEFGENLDANFGALQKDIYAGTYRPGKLKKIKIPKDKKKYRLLQVPTVRDRVLQSATLHILSPAIEMKMSPSSWAYRSGRDIYDALNVANRNLSEGYKWIVDIDIRGYFDNVPHKNLIEELTIWLPDKDIIHLFALWLRGFSLWQKGIAQGSPISPLLANLYLHPVDILIEMAGYRLVRYADDLIIMCRTEQDSYAALRTLSELLRRRRLYLNRYKSSIIEPGTPFEFLGHELVAAK